MDIKPLEGRAKSKFVNNKSWGPYMVLASKNFFRALPVHLNLEIQISRFRDPFFQIFRSRSIRTAPKFFYLPKPYMGPIFCYWHILIQPLLLGAPFIEIVLCSKVIRDYRIWMNREGSEKNFTCQNHIWTTIIVTNKF